MIIFCLQSTLFMLNLGSIMPCLNARFMFLGLKQEMGFRPKETENYEEGNFLKDVGLYKEEHES